MKGKMSLLETLNCKPMDIAKMCALATILVCNGFMFIFLASYLQSQPSIPLSSSSTSTNQAVQEAKLALMHEEIQQLRNEIIDVKQSIVHNHPHNSPSHLNPPKPSTETIHETVPIVHKGADFVHVQKNIFPFNTSLFDDYSSPIVDEDRKVIFCWMAKNSCSKFKRLFAYAAQGWKASEKISMIKFDHQIHEHHELFRQLNAFSEQEADAMMNDESWNKIAFVRDPLERWLSAFAEKCRVSKRDPKDNNPCFGKSVNEFVLQLWEHYEKIDPCGNHDRDSHFFPQWCQCDLWNDHDKWTIYRFDRKNRGSQIDHFLNNFGFKDYVPMFQTSTSHQTKANKTALLQEIQSKPQTKKQLLSLLKKDYMLFFPDLWPPL